MSTSSPMNRALLPEKSKTSGLPSQLFRTFLFEQYREHSLPLQHCVVGKLQGGELDGHGPDGENSAKGPHCHSWTSGTFRSIASITHPNCLLFLIYLRKPEIILLLVTAMTVKFFTLTIWRFMQQFLHAPKNVHWTDDLYQNLLFSFQLVLALCHAWGWIKN